MPQLATLLPARRTELLIRPLGDDGRFVVKDPRTGAFFQLGEAEHLLLTQLDGERTTEEIRAAFAAQFGEPLAEDDLDEFLELARSQGLLQSPHGDPSAPGNGAAWTQPRLPARQSILHWRRSLWDPDRFFTGLAPRIWFFWTPAFLLVATGCIVLAVLLVWTNRQELASSFVHALRWQTVVLVWLTLLLITALHECAHGLTCKHHGGEVHEIGFLLLFLMPCCYCNVSDAWLFRERSKRLWVTFAGGFFELFLWALAVFGWRLTLPGTLAHSLAYVVLSVCGVQTLFNFNPLLKLDGYYLLSDALEVPNLHQRALDAYKSRVRRLLWGASVPAGEPRGRLLAGFGLASWLYSLIFLALVLVGLFQVLGARWGCVGLGVVALVGLVAAPGLFRGFVAGEVSNMIRGRRKRTVVWGLVLGGVVAGLCTLEMEDRAGGAFQTRPAIRAEVRAPVAGFLREVACDEGDRVSPGTLVARLEVPDLASRLAQKQADVREADARLRLLKSGPRPEELMEQRRRVERAQAWQDLARQDLNRLRQVYEAELARLDKQIAQCQAELTAARDATRRASPLLGNAISFEQHEDVLRRNRVCQAQLEQAQAERNARAAKGSLEAETELARRENELADAEATLRLLDAGPRAEEVEAERARMARLQEEAGYLEQLTTRLPVHSSEPGVVTTPRLKEKVGQYLREGELICVVEESACLEVEIALSEEDVGRVQPGQRVALRARTLPFETLSARVDRIAPAAGRGEAQSTVAVYCRLGERRPELRPGMTGYGRVYVGRRPVGGILLDRAVRFLRTECWWW
jgi:multidrug resistance efflux pump